MGQGRGRPKRAPRGGRRVVAPRVAGSERGPGQPRCAGKARISGGLAGPPGERGPKGEDGAPGAPGLTWRGDWDPTATYAATDAVRFEGSSWVARQESQNVEPIEGEDWTLLAAQGEPGEPGPPGGGITSVHGLLGGTILGDVNVTGKTTVLGTLSAPLQAEVLGTVKIGVLSEVLAPVLTKNLNADLLDGLHASQLVSSQLAGRACEPSMIVAGFARWPPTLRAEKGEPAPLPSPPRADAGCRPAGKRPQRVAPVARLGGPSGSEPAQGRGRDGRWREPRPPGRGHAGCHPARWRQLRGCRSDRRLHRPGDRRGRTSRPPKSATSQA